jgi:aminoglycoside phosphotransferase
VTVTQAPTTELGLSPREEAAQATLPAYAEGGGSATMTAWLDEVLGDYSVVGVARQNARKEHTGQLVLEVLDRAGARWFAKEVADPQCWRYEVRAYRRWTPALGDLTPELKASDREARLLLLSAVPGEAPSATDRQAHRQAGALLRRLHEVMPEREQRPVDRRNANGPLHAIFLDRPGLLSEEQEQFARHHLRGLESLPPLPMVPSHGDFNTHNWLVDDAGTLRVIDFGNARWQIPALEFARLYFGPWWDRPDLASSFFEGYGRRPHDHELAFVRHRVVIRAVQSITFGVASSSKRHENFGRARLGRLMDGHDVARPEPALGKMRRRGRDMVGLSGRQ